MAKDTRPLLSGFHGPYLDGDPIGVYDAGRVLNSLGASVSSDHLAHLVTSGELPTIGRDFEGRPLLRYGDVLAYGQARAPEAQAMAKAIERQQRPKPTKTAALHTGMALPGDTTPPK